MVAARHIVCRREQWAERGQESEEMMYWGQRVDMLGDVKGP